MENSKLKTISIFSIVIYGTSMLLALLYGIINSPNKLLYDEPYFINNLEFVLNNGLSKGSLIFYKNQAPGPLFQIFFYFLIKYLGLSFNVINLRLVNFVLFCMSILLYTNIFESFRKKNFWIIFFTFFSIPFFYPILGLALTESTSLFFISVSFYILLKKKTSIISVLIFIASLSLALLGRQTFLAVIPIIFIYIYLSNFQNIRKAVFVISTIISLIPVAYLFYMCGGIVPPEQSFVSGKSIFNISIVNGLLGFGYCSFAFFLFNISVIKKYFNVKLISISFLLSLILVFLFNIKFIPFKSFFDHYIFLQEILSFALPVFIVQLSVTYLFILSLLVIENSKSFNELNIAILLIGLFMSITTLKITHQFSSRYVAQYALFLFLPEKEDKKGTYYFIKIILLLFGSIIGYYSLNSYYSQ